MTSGPVNPPSDDENVNPPTERENANPATERENANPPTERESANPPAEGASDFIRVNLPPSLRARFQELEQLAPGVVTITTPTR